MTNAKVFAVFGGAILVLGIGIAASLLQARKDASANSNISPPAVQTAEQAEPPDIDPKLVSAAEAGNSTAQATLAKEYFSRQEYDAAVRWSAAAAEKGNPDALEILGGLYLTGNGVPQNAHRGAQYIIKAAELRGTYKESTLLSLANDALDLAAGYDAKRMGAYDRGDLTANNQFADLRNDECAGAAQLYRFLARHGNMDAQFELAESDASTAMFDYTYPLSGPGASVVACLNHDQQPPERSAEQFQELRTDAVGKLKSLGERGYLPAIDVLLDYYVAEKNISEPERCAEEEMWIAKRLKLHPSSDTYLSEAYAHMSGPCTLDRKRAFAAICEAKHVASDLNEKSRIEIAMTSFMNDVPSDEAPHYLQGCN